MAANENDKYLGMVAAVENIKEFQIGEWVDALDYNDEWHQAIIMEKSDDYYRVHFQGFTNIHDERIKIASAPKCVVKFKTRTDYLKHSKLLNRSFHVGDEVFISVAQRYLHGLIVRVDHNNYSVATIDAIDNYHKRLHSNPELFEINAFDFESDLNDFKLLRQFSHVYYDEHQNVFPLPYHVSFSCFQTECQVQWKKQWTNQDMLNLPFTDIELIVEKSDGTLITNVHVHKSMLAIHSLYFAALLFGPFSKSSDNSVIHLEIDIEHKESFLAVLTFLYQGTFHVTETTWLEILHLANYLQIESLQQQIIKIDINHFLTFGNVESVWKQSCAFGFDDIREQMISKIPKMVEKYVNTKNRHEFFFKKLPHDLLCTIIERIKSTTTTTDNIPHPFVVAFEKGNYGDGDGDQTMK